MSPLLYPPIHENGCVVLDHLGGLVPRADTAVRHTRDALVLRLFLSGHSYRQIATHPKVQLSPKGVGNVVNKQLAQASPRQLSNHGVDVYIERLETMLRVAWPKALAGDLKAVMVCLRVLKQESKFYGLDEGVADDDLLAVVGLNPLEQYRDRRG